MTADPDRRRLDDRRLDEFETTVRNLGLKVDGMSDTVTQIRDMLISEPEASPLGRVLVKRADTNSTNIEKLDVRVDALEQWKDQAVGAYQATRVIQVLVGVAVGFLTIWVLIRDIT